jgi:signal transduction histidine kinase
MAELQDILEARLADVGISDVHVERRDEVARAAAPEAASPPVEDPGPIEAVLADLELELDKTGAYVASIALSDGQWLNFTVSLAPRGLLWTPRTIAFAALIILVVLAACLFIVRYLTAPFRLLGHAAERIGNDLNAPGLPERGPRELRAAAHALNVMQNRLQRVVADRDQLVAAIAHDLRTPITRLRLRADMIEDGAQRERMVADVDEIAGMTQSILAFASNNATPERRENLDLISMLETLSSDLPAATLTLPPDCPPRIAYFGEPIALRRCIGNLIENAIKYGGAAHVTLSVDARSVVVRVDDEGPGIPDSELEAVFAPFRRLETSRSRETGGTGLGLTIARTIARAHGGDIRLVNLAKGLRAELVLPVTEPPNPARIA